MVTLAVTNYPRHNSDTSAAFSPDPNSAVPEHQDVDGAVGAGRLHRHDEAAARGPPAGQGEAVSLFVYFYEFVYF